MTSNRERRPRIWSALLHAWDTTGVTVTALLVLMPAMTLTDASVSPSDLPTITRVGIGLSGWLILAGVLLVSNQTVIERLRPGIPRRIAVLTAYALGATTRVLVVAGLVGAASPDSDVHLSWMPVRWASTFIWLNATAIVMSWLRRSARAARRLSAERQHAELVRTQLEDEVVRTRQQLIAARTSVRASVTATLMRLSRPLDRDNFVEIAHELRTAVDDLVRPTSHELVQTPDDEDGLPLLPDPPRLRWRDYALDFLRAWPTAGPFQWWVTLAFSAPIAIAALLTDPNQGATGLLFIGYVTQMAVLVVASAALPQLLGRLDWGVGLAIVFGVYAVMIAIGVTAAALAGVARPSPEAWILPTLVAALTGGANALDARARRSEHAAEIVLAEIEWQIGRTHQQLWAERRRLAVILHGQVQAVLTACVALIDQWLDNAVAMDAPALATRLRETLEHTTDLDESKQVQRFESSVYELVTTWTGVIDIEATISDAAAAALDADADGCYAATEAVRELVLNTVRHSHATHVAVTADLRDGRVVELVVAARETTALPDRRDQARTDASVVVDRRQRDRGTAGIGLSLLDSIAMSWTTVESAGRRTTTLRIPTGGGDTDGAVGDGTSGYPLGREDGSAIRV